MLFELATGNLTFRLSPDETGDDLSRLLQSLTSFAAQFQLAIRKSGYVAPYYSYQNLTQFIFVLNAKWNVIAFSQQIPQIVKRESGGLFDLPFEQLLDESSKNELQTLIANLSNLQIQSTVQLRIIDADSKIKPFYCTVSKLLHTDMIIISSFTTNLDELVELNLAARAADKPSDALIIQNLCDYILSNLDRPLPTLKELAQLFQTNEFKLKRGFRNFFNTSIYQFYNEQRLKRSHTLIEQTNLPLKTIGFMCGFQDYVTFAKAFKKRFGDSPSHIIRHSE